MAICAMRFELSHEGEIRAAVRRKIEATTPVRRDGPGRQTSGRHMPTRSWKCLWYVWTSNVCALHGVSGRSVKYLSSCPGNYVSSVARYTCDEE